MVEGWDGHWLENITPQCTKYEALKKHKPYRRLFHIIHKL